MLQKRLGEKRVISKRYWFPIRFDAHWYWLQKLLVVQEIKEVDVGGSMEWGNYSYEWVTTGLDDLLP